jgi:hypothetical protein
VNERGYWPCDIGQVDVREKVWLEECRCGGIIGWMALERHLLHFFGLRRHPSYEQ